MIKNRGKSDKIKSVAQKWPLFLLSSCLSTSTSDSLAAEGITPQPSTPTTLPNHDIADYFYLVDIIIPRAEAASLLPPPNVSGTQLNGPPDSGPDGTPTATCPDPTGNGQVYHPSDSNLFAAFTPNDATCTPLSLTCGTDGAWSPAAYITSCDPSAGSCNDSRLSSSPIPAGPIGTVFVDAPSPNLGSCGHILKHADCTNGQITINGGVPYTGTYLSYDDGCADCTTPWGDDLVTGQTTQTSTVNSVPFGDICPIENATCTNGVLYYDDNSVVPVDVFPASACVVSSQASQPPAGCNDTPWGPMSSGSSNTGYTNDHVAFNATCDPQIAVCSNGNLTYQDGTPYPPDVYTSCVRDCITSDDPGVPPVSITSGQNYTGFPSATVPYNQTCPQTTVSSCTDGTLSAPVYAVCNALPAADCDGTWGTAINGDPTPIPIFQYPTPPDGVDSCNPQNPVCDNGVMHFADGTEVPPDAFTSCEPPAPVTCTHDGQTFEEGQGNTFPAFTPQDPTCTPLQLTCIKNSNGTGEWSPSTFVEVCIPGCQDLSGNMVVNNGSPANPAWAASSPTANQTCDDLALRCTNGMWTSYSGATLTDLTTAATSCGAVTCKTLDVDPPNTVPAGLVTVPIYTPQGKADGTCTLAGATTCSADTPILNVYLACTPTQVTPPGKCSVTVDGTQSFVDVGQSYNGTVYSLVPINNVNQCYPQTGVCTQPSGSQSTPVWTITTNTMQGNVVTTSATWSGSSTSELCNAPSYTCKTLDKPPANDIVNPGPVSPAYTSDGTLSTGDGTCTEVSNVVCTASTPSLNIYLACTPLPSNYGHCVATIHSADPNIADLTENYQDTNTLQLYEAATGSPCIQHTGVCHINSDNLGDWTVDNSSTQSQFEGFLDCKPSKCTLDSYTTDTNFTTTYLDPGPDSHTTLWQKDPTLGCVQQSGTCQSNPDMGAIWSNNNQNLWSGYTTQDACKATTTNKFCGIYVYGNPPLDEEVIDYEGFDVNDLTMDYFTTPTAPCIKPVRFCGDTGWVVNGVATNDNMGFGYDECNGAANAQQCTVTIRDNNNQMINYNGGFGTGAPPANPPFPLYLGDANGPTVPCVQQVGVCQPLGNGQVGWNFQVPHTQQWMAYKNCPPVIPPFNLGQCTLTVDGGAPIAVNPGQSSWLAFGDVYENDSCYPTVDTCALDAAGVNATWMTTGLQGWAVSANPSLDCFENNNYCILVKDGVNKNVPVGGSSGKVYIQNTCPSQYGTCQNSGNSSGAPIWSSNQMNSWTVMSQPPSYCSPSDTPSSGSDSPADSPADSCPTTPVKPYIPLLHPHRPDTYMTDLCIMGGQSKIDPITGLVDGENNQSQLSSAENFSQKVTGTESGVAPLECTPMRATPKTSLADPEDYNTPFAHVLNKDLDQPTGTGPDKYGTTNLYKRKIAYPIPKVCTDAIQWKSGMEPTHERKNIPIFDAYVEQIKLDCAKEMLLLNFGKRDGNDKDPTHVDLLKGGPQYIVDVPASGGPELLTRFTGNDSNGDPIKGPERAAMANCEHIGDGDKSGDVEFKNFDEITATYIDIPVATGSAIAPAISQNYLPSDYMQKTWNSSFVDFVVHDPLLAGKIELKSGVADSHKMNFAKVALPCLKPVTGSPATAGPACPATPTTPNPCSIAINADWINPNPELADDVKQWCGMAVAKQFVPSDDPAMYGPLIPRGDFQKNDRMWSEEIPEIVPETCFPDGTPPGDKTTIATNPDNVYAPGNMISYNTYAADVLTYGAGHTPWDDADALPVECDIMPVDVLSFDQAAFNNCMMQRIQINQDDFLQRCDFVGVCPPQQTLASSLDPASAPLNYVPPCATREFESDDAAGGCVQANGNPPALSVQDCCQIASKNLVLPNQQQLDPLNGMEQARIDANVVTELSFDVNGFPVFDDEGNFATHAVAALDPTWYGFVPPDGQGGGNYYTADGTANGSRDVKLTYAKFKEAIQDTIKLTNCSGCTGDGSDADAFTFPNWATPFTLKDPDHLDDPTKSATVYHKPYIALPDTGTAFASKLMFTEPGDATGGLVALRGIGRPPVTKVNQDRFKKDMNTIFDDSIPCHHFSWYCAIKEDGQSVLKGANSKNGEYQLHGDEKSLIGTKGFGSKTLAGVPERYWYSADGYRKTGFLCDVRPEKVYKPLLAEEFAYVAAGASITTPAKTQTDFGANKTNPKMSNTINWGHRDVGYFTSTEWPLPGGSGNPGIVTQTDDDPPQTITFDNLNLSDIIVFRYPGVEPKGYIVTHITNEGGDKHITLRAYSQDKFVTITGSSIGDGMSPAIEVYPDSIPSSIEVNNAAISVGEMEALAGNDPKCQDPKNTEAGSCHPSCLDPNNTFCVLPSAMDSNGNYTSYWSHPLDDNFATIYRPKKDIHPCPADLSAYGFSMASTYVPNSTDPKAVKQPQSIQIPPSVWLGECIRRGYDNPPWKTYMNVGIGAETPGYFFGRGVHSFSGGSDTTLYPVDPPATAR